MLRQKSHICCTLALPLFSYHETSQERKTEDA